MKIRGYSKGASSGSGVVVPNFAAIMAAQPSVTPNIGMGATIGLTIADTLGGILSQAGNNAEQKKLIYGMADTIADTNPQQASVYRAMADGMSIWSPLTGGGSSRGVGSGGGGGITSGPNAGIAGMVMSDMLSTLREARMSEAESKRDAARTESQMALEKMRIAGQLQEIGARRDSELKLHQDIAEFDANRPLSAKEQSIENDKKVDQSIRITELGLRQQQNQTMDGIRQQQADAIEEDKKAKAPVYKAEADKHVAEALGAISHANLWQQQADKISRQITGTQSPREILSKDKNFSDLEMMSQNDEFFKATLKNLNSQANALEGKDENGNPINERLRKSPIDFQKANAIRQKMNEFKQKVNLLRSGGNPTSDFISRNSGFGRTQQSGVIPDYIYTPSPQSSNPMPIKGTSGE